MVQYITMRTFVSRTLSRAAWGCLFVLCLLAGPLFAQDTQYGRTIYLPADASAQMAGTAEALKRWLVSMTGTGFVITHEKPARGIMLALESTPGLPVDAAKLRAQESGEAFHIYSDGQDVLWIIGNTALGLDRGVFWYLDRLGCRWLHASEKWTVIPRRDDIRLQLDEVQAPAFFTRDFFGTGGFGRPTYDPRQRLAETWVVYKRQNLLGGTYRLGGHTGEYINLKYKAELEAHPEYVAEVNGERKLTATSKLCTANPGLQALFVKDRLETFKRTLATDPAAKVISVEPADGGGHCSCPECLKLGSVSDRVFTLANAAARAVAAELPGKYVNLLAYNEHAAVPNIPLEPNTIVQLAPYAFQRTGMTPHQMIQAWGKKHNFLGVYTYWSIPDWARCLPALSTKSVVEEIRFWQANNVRLHSSESTFCGGNMGPNWYLASRLMWNPARDEQAILDDYYATAFGAAKGPVRRMYDRWDGGFMLTDHEVALCYKDLNEALALATDPGVRARLVDLGRYVHFLRLWYQFQQAKGDARIEAAKTLNSYFWQVYDSNMVQSFRMAQLLVRDMKPHLDAVNTQAEIWQDTPQLTDEEILALVADGTANYHTLDYQPIRYTGKLAPLQPAGAADGASVTTTIFSVSSTFAFAAQTPGRVLLKMRVNKVAGRTDHVLVTDPQGKTVFDRRLEATGEWVELDIPTPAAGIYTLAITDQKTFFTLQAPANLPFVCTGAYTCPTLSARAWFFVPRGLQKVAVYSPSVIPIRIYDPNGKPVTVERNEQGNPLFLIDVPEGMDGKLWSFDRFKAYSGLKLLNAPSVFSFSKEGMMVPEDALR